jgi:hypothetical protein
MYESDKNNKLCEFINSILIFGVLNTIQSLLIFVLAIKDVYS